MTNRAFITGATGYMGTRLIPRLLDRGWQVLALARPGSERRLPAGSGVVLGDALQSDSYRLAIEAGDTVVHLVGVARPSPAKAAEFERIDYVSAVEAIRAAKERRAAHFVYLSVAHPAPVMRAYWQVRARCEKVLSESGLRATVLRPWYVLGPDHRWPVILKPLYCVAELVPSMRETATRLGMVTIDQMTDALERAVTEPADQCRIWDTTDIRRAASNNERETA